MDNEITINGEVYVKKSNLRFASIVESDGGKGEVVILPPALPLEEKPWPQEGDEFWYVNREGLVFGDLYWREPLHVANMRGHGNFFRTKEEAQMYSLRIESLSKGEVLPLFSGGEAGADRLLIAIDFPDSKECQEWYDKYGASWLYLINNNKK